MDQKLKKDLEKLAVKIRIATVEEFKARGFGHIGGSLSMVDALTVLYGSVMNVDPKDPKKEDRDKLVCSKGHSGPGLYATLAVKGFFPYEELKTLNQPHTHLPSHCDRNLTPGIDMTTGSLAQGASLAVGMALADKLKGLKSRTYVIVGDGEAAEGQIWEAAMFTAGKKVNNLVWLLDENKKQLDGRTENVLPQFDFREKFEAFGFEAVRINGNDLEQLYDVLTKEPGDKPLAIIMDTIKGYGVREVAEMENNHSINVTDEQCDRWIAELEAELAELEKA